MANKTDTKNATGTEATKGATKPMQLNVSFSGDEGEAIKAAARKGGHANVQDYVRVTLGFQPAKAEKSAWTL